MTEAALKLIKVMAKLKTVNLKDAIKWHEEAKRIVREEKNELER